MGIFLVAAHRSAAPYLASVFAQWDSRLLLRFLDFLCLLNDKRFYASKLFLSSLRKIVWSVFKQNDEAKSQNDKQDEPK
jgi:hypothetical protein